MGWLRLHEAVVLEQRVTSKSGRKRMLQRRNEAIRAAHRRGVPILELAKKLGLTQHWIKQVIKDPEKAAIEEAA